MIFATYTFLDTIKKTNRDAYLARTYGLKPGEWEAMLIAQGNVCAICKKKKRRYDTDHDHKTGKVRGVICHRCNVMLGHARDSHSILQSGAEYLLKFVILDDSLNKPPISSV